ncbi:MULTISPECIES: hypothetical protein [Gordonia]|uniref:hypothetical protein n=1 Tax=Gordonia TaxID=2053 RepID=UPI0030FE3A9B
MEDLTPFDLTNYPISARCLKTIQSSDGGLNVIGDLAKAVVTAIVELEQEVVSLRAIVAERPSAE